jgi:hypothetical protein
MDPGARDRAVIVEQLVPSIGPSRFPVEDWTVLAPIVWMSKRHITGTERQTMDQKTAPFEDVWETAYRADLDPELVDVPKTRRLVYQGRAFDIIDANQIGRREGVQLMTRARQG